MLIYTVVSTIKTELSWNKVFHEKNKEKKRNKKEKIKSAILPFGGFVPCSGAYAGGVSSVFGTPPPVAGQLIIHTLS